MTSYGYIIMIIVDSYIIWLHLIVSRSWSNRIILLLILVAEKCYYFWWSSWLINLSLVSCHYLLIWARTGLNAWICKYRHIKVWYVITHPCSYSMQASLLSNQISLIHGSRIKWKSLSCQQFRPYSYQILCPVGGTSPPTGHKIW